MIYKNISETIGNTQHIHLSRFFPEGNIIAKIESGNPGFSVKDRIAKAMIDTAEKNGQLKKGGRIVESTSGNTGIGLALVAVSRGYSVTLVMPDTLSIERRQMMKFLGANLVLTDGTLGMKGAIKKAEEIVKESGAFQPQQFENPANPLIHFETTGPEIWEVTEGNIDYFVSGVGTGGTISGAGKYLKSKGNVHVVAVEPKESPVLSGGKPSPHKIQGIGAGFIPTNYDSSVVDSIEAVSAEEALETAKKIAKTEGILAGISSGAALVAARRVSQKNPKKTVVVILPDTAERYLSTALFAEV